jgi:pimeloyl-ACP methyl ester carboxylesterase
MNSPNAVTSRDGTTIAYYRTGTGPALIIVDGAMCHHSFGPAAALAEVLSADFTVYGYDRRGRGASTDAARYSVAREIEDIDALIAEAGGSAHAFGFSSGAALALEAAASGSPIARLALFEPPYTGEFTNPAEIEEEHARITALLDDGRHSEAAESFLSYVLSPEAVKEMKESPVWPMFEAVAPTLAYDNAVMGDGTVPRGRAAKVSVPTMVTAGGGSPDVLRQAARAVAEAVPGARFELLEGLDHTSSPEPHAPALRAFFSAG